MRFRGFLFIYFLEESNNGNKMTGEVIWKTKRSNHDAFILYYYYEMMHSF